MDPSEKADRSKAIVGAFREDCFACIFGSGISIGSDDVAAAMVAANVE